MYIAWHWYRCNAHNVLVQCSVHAFNAVLNADAFAHKMCAKKQHLYFENVFTGDHILRW